MQCRINIVISFSALLKPSSVIYRIGESLWFTIFILSGCFWISDSHRRLALFQSWLNKYSFNANTYKLKYFYWKKVSFSENAGESILPTIEKIQVKSSTICLIADRYQFTIFCFVYLAIFMHYLKKTWPKHTWVGSRAKLSLLV